MSERHASAATILSGESRVSPRRHDRLPCQQAVAARRRSPGPLSGGPQAPCPEATTGGHRVAERRNRRYSADDARSIERCAGSCVRGSEVVSVTASSSLDGGARRGAWLLALSIVLAMAGAGFGAGLLTRGSPHGVSAHSRSLAKGSPEPRAEIAQAAAAGLPALRQVRHHKNANRSSSTISGQSTAGATLGSTQATSVSPLASVPAPTASASPTAGSAPSGSKSGNKAGSGGGLHKSGGGLE
jgi:hypothetical protein